MSVNNKNSINSITSTKTESSKMKNQQNAINRNQSSAFEEVREKTDGLKSEVKVRTPQVYVAKREDKFVPPQPEKISVSDLLISLVSILVPDVWFKTEIQRIIDGGHIAIMNMLVDELSTIQLNEELTLNQKIHKTTLSLDVIIRPRNSMLHKDTPCPASFMQRDNLYIDGINCNVKALGADELLWWTPVTDIPSIEFANAVNRYKASLAIGNTGQNIVFCNINKNDLLANGTSEKPSVNPINLNQ